MKKRKSTKKRKMAELGSIGGKRSAERLNKAERHDRAVRAATYRYARERQRDEHEAAQTPEEIRAEIKRTARELIEAAIDDSGNAPVGSLAVELQRRYKFVLSLADAKKLVKGQISWRGRNVAVEAHAVPRENS